MNQIRTRFAPSPTGSLHIGSLRTALFAFLFARKNNGKVILRIEDTDQNRLVEGAVTQLITSLTNLGISFDEGPSLINGQLKEVGDFGPYVQSARLDLYQKYANELVENKQAYYCYCSDERLAELRKEQVALKKPPMYDRHCKNLSAEDLDKAKTEAEKEGRGPVIRFAIPQDGQTVVNDLVYGEIVYDNKLLDDQVILKSDGFPTYHLAVVIDDHLMAISHVIRGEEWIPSTPKHLLLYKAFGWEAPAFAHLPLILNPDKSKLSKRQGDVSLEDFLQKGYLPQALLNFVALLGWNPKTEQEIFSLDELISQFDLAKVNKSGAVFDVNKLDWMNAQYIKNLSNEDLARLLVPYWQNARVVLEASGGYQTASSKPLGLEYLSAISGLEKERLKKFSDIVDTTNYFFSKPEGVGDLLVSPKSSPEKTKQGLELVVQIIKNQSSDTLDKEQLEAELKEAISSAGLGNFDCLWPMRVALTGQKASPGPFEVAATLSLGYGKDEVIKRLEEAISQIN